MSDSPQLEDGYTRIANVILEALCRYRIPGEQRQCLDFILRKTYGYGKKEDAISNGQFCQATGMKKGNVARALGELVKKRVVIKSDNGRIPTYQFNKIYSDWLSILQPVIKTDNKEAEIVGMVEEIELLPENPLVINITTPVIKTDNELLSKVMDTKEKKKSLQKKVSPIPPKEKNFKNWNREDFIHEIAAVNADWLLTLEEIDDFVAYWMEKSASGKTKLSMQKTWDTRRRMQTALSVVFEKRRNQQLPVARTVRDALILDRQISRRALNELDRQRSERANGEATASLPRGFPDD